MFVLKKGKGMEKYMIYFCFDWLKLFEEVKLMKLKKKVKVSEWIGYFKSGFNVLFINKSRCIILLMMIYINKIMFKILIDLFKEKSLVM